MRVQALHYYPRRGRGSGGWTILRVLPVAGCAALMLLGYDVTVAPSHWRLCAPCAALLYRRVAGTILSTLSDNARGGIAIGWGSRVRVHFAVRGRRLRASNALAALLCQQVAGYCRRIPPRGDISTVSVRGDRG